MSSGTPSKSSSDEAEGSQASPRPSRSLSLWTKGPGAPGGLAIPGQLSGASAIPSTSASSLLAEQPAAGAWRAAVWQTPPAGQAGSIAPGAAVQATAGALLQILTDRAPSQSPSQASPIPSLSRSFWSAFPARTQLSERSGRPSPSRSCVGSWQAKPRVRSQNSLNPLTHSDAARHGAVGAAGVYTQCPSWPGLKTSAQLSMGFGTPSPSRSSKSQASPTPSRSRSDCNGSATTMQSSHESPIPSASPSCWPGLYWKRQLSAGAVSPSPSRSSKLCSPAAPSRSPSQPG